MSELTDDRLLPCPGCGRNVGAPHDDEGDGLYFVDCAHCGWRGPRAYNLTDAWNRWNRRAAASTSTEGAGVDRIDAERWRALMSSPKMHWMGSAGFNHVLRPDAPVGSRALEDQDPTPRPGDQWHFGMEFWYGLEADPLYPDTFERRYMVAYVDAIRAHNAMCPSCEGTGTDIYDRTSHDCQVCHGTGRSLNPPSSKVTTDEAEERG